MLLVCWFRPWLTDQSLTSLSKSWTFWNATWQMAVIFKIEKSWYLCNVLTDRRKIWHAYAHWYSSPKRPSKLRTFQNSTWRTAAMLKTKKSWYYLTNALTNCYEITVEMVTHKHWTVHVRRRCGLLSNYFHQLLRPPGQAIIFIIFLSCGFFFLLLYFPGLFSVVADWMSIILPHMMWP